MNKYLMTKKKKALLLPVGRCWCTDRKPWTKHSAPVVTSDMELQQELSVVNLSKVELLRAVVVEKLTTAAQEIMAVVERTVASYEEEASSFREEVDRQKKQLELLLETRHIKTESSGTGTLLLFTFTTMMTSSNLSLIFTISPSRLTLVLYSVRMMKCYLKVRFWEMKVKKKSFYKKYFFPLLITSLLIIQ